MMMRLLLLALTLLVGASGSAHAASFNCTYAKLPTEVAICVNEDLSSYDEQNARLYFGVRNSLSGRELRAFNARERGWLSERNACGYEPTCVSNQYTWHISYLCRMAASVGLEPMDDCHDLEMSDNDDHAPHTGIVGVDPWDPDPFLALRTNPTTRYGQRIAKLRNGTRLEILDATRPDGWWLVRTPNDQTGWAKSGAGWDGKERSWIHAGYTSATAQ